MHEDELDLRSIVRSVRPMVRAVLRRWPLILGFALITALCAYVHNRLSDPIYVAQVEVAIVDLQTQVVVQSGLPDESQVVVQSDIKDGSQQTDPEALTAGLVTLARSGTVAQEVIKALGDTLPVSLRKPGSLRQLIVVDAKGMGNMIQIRANTSDAALSELLVNAWGTAFEELANATFGKTIGSDLSDEVEQGRTDLAMRLERLAYSELPHEIAGLERRIADLGAIVTSLRASQLQAITSTLVQQTNQRTALMNLYSSAYRGDQLVPLDAERQRKIDEFNTLHATAARLRLLRDDVRAFRDQVRQGSTGGSSFAYMLLKATLFAGSSALPTTIQVQTAASATDVPTVADLDALLTNTEDRLKVIDEQIAELATAFRNGTAYHVPEPAELNAHNPAFHRQLDSLLAQPDAAHLLKSLGMTETGVLVSDPIIEQLDKKRQELGADLKTKEGQLFVLQQEYDQAKANYAALSSRVTEVQAANAGRGAVVRLVGEGVLIGMTKNVLVSTSTAFMLGVILASAFVILHSRAIGWLGESGVPAMRQRRLFSQ